MQDPFRMIVISLMSSAVLLFGILFYTYIYPKKNIRPLILLILISVLPLISMMRPGSYESGDLSEHIKLAMMFYNELTQGNFIPGWTDIGCSGYGCPIFSFIYIFPYYIISFFHIIGFSFVASVKLLLAVSFIISGVTMYVWAKDEFGEKAGFIAGIFYLFAPYHLVDLHFRNAIGEIVAFAILPLCFLFTKKIIIDKTSKWIFLNGVTIGLLILSHLAATVITLPFLLVYAFLVLKRKKIIKKVSVFRLAVSFSFGLFLTCFYWLPVALEGKYTLWGANSHISFFTIDDLLFSPWRYGFLFQGPHGEHSHLVGYIHIITVLFGCYFLIKNKITKKIEKRVLLFFIISFLITFFMITSFSKSVWDTIPLLKSFQFSYRLLIFINLSTAIIAAILLKNIKTKRIIIIICFLTIMSTILNWGNRKAVATINDTVLHDQAFVTEIATSSLTEPIWTDDSPIYWKKRIKEKDKLEIVSGTASVKKITNLSKHREYLINAKTDVVIKENTFYFPGWKVYLNNKETPIIYTDKKYPGTVIFHLKKGLYKVDIIFTDTIARKIGKYISLATALFSSFQIVFFIRRRLSIKYNRKILT